MYRAHIAKSHEPIRTDASLDQLVPKDHLVRKLDRHIDESYHEAVSENLVAATAQNMKKLAKLLAKKTVYIAFFQFYVGQSASSSLNTKKRRTHSPEANGFVNSLKTL